LGGIGKKKTGAPVPFFTVSKSFSTAQLGGSHYTLWSHCPNINVFSDCPKLLYDESEVRLQIVPDSRSSCSWRIGCRRWRASDWREAYEYQTSLIGWASKSSARWLEACPDSAWCTKAATVNSTCCRTNGRTPSYQRILIIH